MKSTQGIKILLQALEKHTNPGYKYSIDTIVFHYAAPKHVKQLLTGMHQKVLPQLQTLELWSEKQQSLPQCVPELINPTMSSLHTLVLSKTTAVHRTVKAVVSTNTLKKLALYDCDINDECVTTLCQWLSTSSQLEALAITLPSPNAMHGIEMISTALTTNFTLKTLGLWESKFNLPAMQAMCHMLTHNSTIIEVRLPRFDTDNEDITNCLAESLNSNNTLTTLRIRNNSVSDGGAVSIAKALYNNSALTTLDISINSISDRGAVCIAEMLKSNKTLQKVDLSYNYIIGNEGQMALQEASSTNRHINYTPQEIRM